MQENCTCQHNTIIYYIIALIINDTVMHNENFDFIACGTNSNYFTHCSVA